ncbi:entericidin [Rhodobacter sp. Har01]|nr:entericidin [Rhodobacter sp. Har01]MCB6177130.1 entericidin [Rhodobacter sp. Har01]
MKRLILLAAALAALQGCNTVAGVGEDVSGGARKVQGWLN